MGAGQGQPVEAEVEGGVVGLVVDTRGRPLEVSTLHLPSVSRLLKKWFEALEVYPERFV